MSLVKFHLLLSANLFRLLITLLTVRDINLAFAEVQAVTVDQDGLISGSSINLYFITLA